jgi:hypothetical protein
MASLLRLQKVHGPFVRPSTRLIYVVAILL